MGWSRAGMLLGVRCGRWLMLASWPTTSRPRPTEVLQRLIRFNTVNPPGNERAAIEYLEAYVREAGFETELLAAEPERPNLIATLPGRSRRADAGLPGARRHGAGRRRGLAARPLVGEIADGFLWGRGALDMKNQVAAEAVAAVRPRPQRLAPRARHAEARVRRRRGDRRRGRRPLADHAAPRQGPLRLPVNEGAGAPFEFEGNRYYGVCCGEKGIFRFKLTANGMAGHASMPRLGDNALLKLAPVIAALRPGFSGYDPTEAPLLMLAGLGLDPEDIPGAIARLGAEDPLLPVDRRADAQRHADADDDLGLGEDERDPGASIAEGRLPRAARARRGGCAQAPARAARRGRRRARHRVHREGSTATSRRPAAS